jgi:hypothetical protein
VKGLFPGCEMRHLWRQDDTPDGDTRPRGQAGQIFGGLIQWVHAEAPRAMPPPA